MIKSPSRASSRTMVDDDLISRNSRRNTANDSGSYKSKFSALSILENGFINDVGFDDSDIIDSYGFDMTSEPTPSMRLIDQALVNEFQPEIKTNRNVADIFVPLFVGIALLLISKLGMYIGQQNVCNRKVNISPIIMSTEYACFVAFVANSLTILIKIQNLIVSDDLSKRPILKLYTSSLIISLVSASTIAYHWLFSIESDYLCVDSMGVPSFITQWCEWLPIVPFLVYLACMIDKHKLSPSDCFATISSALMIVFGFLSAIFGTYGYHYAGYVFHCVGIGFFLSQVRYLLSCTGENKLTSMVSPSSGVHAEILRLRLQSKKHRGFTLSCSFIVFPLIHGLKWIDILTQDATICAFMLASTFIKIGVCCCFVESINRLTNRIAKLVSITKSDIIDEQSSVNSNNLIEIDKLSEFRNMLGNVAHDLKTPLAGFSGAVGLIEEEILNMWKEINEWKNHNSSFILSNLMDNSKSLISSIERRLSAMETSINSVTLDMHSRKFILPFGRRDNLHPNWNRTISTTAVGDVAETNESLQIISTLPEIGEKDRIVSAITDYSCCVTSNGGIRVLLVDDSDMIRKLVFKKLCGAGFNVDSAENGYVAVDKVIKSMEENNNNAMVMSSCDSNDQRFPDMDFMMDKPFDLIKFKELVSSLKISTKL
eukprot:gene14072-18880_t